MPFTRLYMRPDNPIEDSTRVRHRLSILISRVLESTDDNANLGEIIELNTGVPVLQINDWGDMNVDWQNVFKIKDFTDLLDMLTFCYRYLRKYKQEHISVEFLKIVRQIFSDHYMKYSIDDKCGFHPFIDQGFEYIRYTTLSSLGGTEFETARLRIEEAERAMIGSHFSGVLAIRSIFSAAENVFKMMYGGDSLKNKEIMDKMQKDIEILFRNSGENLRAAQRQVKGFASWVDGAHNYRHESGTPAPSEPPHDLAVHMISTGLAHVRWLACLHQQKQMTS